MNRFWMYAVLLTGFSVQAQTEQVRHASITGSGGTSGKCTIELRVDIAAEVDVYGDSGRVRTLAGQPATWTRLECTGPLPYAMSDFRFKGVDGRGNVNLIQDPRNNNGMATIRIEDPKAGAEGYTFDIEWSGASAAGPTGPFDSSLGNRSGGTRSGIDTHIPYPGYRSGRLPSTERTLDLCRAEVHTRAERDYALRDIDITSVGVDTTSGRRDWITGTFVDGAPSYRTDALYRFNCSVNYRTGEIVSVEFRRNDGAVLQPQRSTTTYGYTRDRILRDCQDAAVARISRDGYENVRFASTTLDTRRADWVSGTATANRGSITDSLDFGCSIDPVSSRIRSVEVNRR